MLIDNYLKEKYWYEIYNHEKERCSCELKDGGQGICLIGQYLEGVITAREYLKVQNDELLSISCLLGIIHYTHDEFDFSLLELKNLTMKYFLS